MNVKFKDSLQQYKTIKTKYKTASLLVITQHRKRTTTQYREVKITQRRKRNTTQHHTQTIVNRQYRRINLFMRRSFEIIKSMKYRIDIF